MIAAACPHSDDSSGRQGGSRGRTRFAYEGGGRGQARSDDRHGQHGAVSERRGRGRQRTLPIHPKPARIQTSQWLGSHSEKGVLLGGPFCHVETTYRRDASEAELAAYYRLAPDHEPATEAQHAEELRAKALGDMPHVLGAVSLFP